MSENRKATMVVKNVGNDTQRMKYPIEVEFPPDTEVEVSYSIGKGLINQLWCIEVKKKERAPDPDKAEDKKKRKVK